MNLADPVVQIKLTSSICTSVAILTTVIRLFVRRGKFWFDDGCALFSMLCVTVQMGVIVTLRPPYFPSYYVLVSTFYSTVWFARLSILLTLIRLGSERRSRHLFPIVILFLLLFGVLIGQAFWVCEPQRTRGDIICIPTKQVAIFKIISDVIADFVLLVTSLELFLAIQDRALRFRLSCLFSTCVITTAVSLVNSSFILSSKGLKVVFIALVETSLSLIVANIPIVSNLCSRIGEHAPCRTSRGEASSMIHFARQTDEQVSRITLCETCPIPVGTCIMIKASPPDDMA